MATYFFKETIFSDGRMFILPILSKATATEHLKLHVPQWVQASSSMTCFVAIFAEWAVSFSMTALVKRLMGLAMICIILLKGR